MIKPEDLIEACMRSIADLAREMSKRTPKEVSGAVALELFAQSLEEANGLLWPKEIINGGN